MLTKISMRNLNIIVAIVAILTFLCVGTMSVSAAVTSTNKATIYVNSSDGAYIRKSASTLSSKVKLVKDNTKLKTDYVYFTSKTKTGAKYKWYHVSYSGKKGYIRSDCVDDVTYSAVAGKTTDSVNYRAGAGTSMKSYGVLSKNKQLMIYLKAKTKYSSDTWYLTKVGSKYRYVSGKYVKITGSVFETPDEPSKPDNTDKPDNNGSNTSNMSDSEYKAYLEKLGFPSAYRTKLLALHKKHPKWNFVAIKTGIAFDTALNAEFKDGKSLIEGSHPVAWRDKGANSFKPANDTGLYKEASTKNKLVTMSNGASVTILSEKYDSSGTRWTKVTTSAGKTGYTKATINSQSYSKTISAKVNDDDVNIRDGAGTSSGISVLGSASKNDKVTVVLTALDKSGKTWYKIKRSSGFGYIISDYVTLDNEAADLSALKGSGNVSSTGSGKYIPKDGSTWFNAHKNAIAYYMDPRNFLDETRIFMFEDLSYNESSQDLSVVTSVLSGTKLPDCGFTSKMFVDAGKKYSVSPVHLASRARQETGGGSPAISGTKYNGVKVYNPYNIGATSSSNPVMNGIKYAYNAGWTTQKKAVEGGAKFLANDYIKVGQYTTYLQKWNVANGSAKLATHQYMTNIRGPYDESSSTASAYKKYNIYESAVTFAIPVYNSMPSKTQLPG